MDKWTRREFDLSLAALTPAALALNAQTSGSTSASKLAMPGPFKGRVVSIHNPSSLTAAGFHGEEIHKMMYRGITTLTGAPSLKEAWGTFVEKGDVVGIKVNPVGQPHVISSPEVLREIVFGLKTAGVRAEDIVVYDRYRAQFLKAGFDKWLPEKVRWSHAVEDYEEVQQAIEGYDPDHYMDMALTLPGQDVNNLTARRSYAANFITKQVNKLINLPLLKDHQSAGVTLALKNLSHGLVNNVCRSHSTKTLNTCGAFIPAVVAMPVIRSKAVLHILDGIKGVYHGGPGARPEYVFTHHTMYFASDPVALDHVCWREIDKVRVAKGKKPLYEDLPDAHSTFARRQPEHVELAAALGLGEFDLSKIDLKQIKIGA